MSWTDKLIDPLAMALRETGPWLRVEESRTGGWICLSGNPGDPAVNWHHLEADGSLDRKIMPDFLHLSPRGYEIWASSIEGKLKELLGG